MLVCRVWRFGGRLIAAATERRAVSVKRSDTILDGNKGTILIQWKRALWKGTIDYGRV